MNLFPVTTLGSKIKIIKYNEIQCCLLNLKKNISQYYAITRSKQFKVVFVKMQIGGYSIDALQEI